MFLCFYVNDYYKLQNTMRDDIGYDEADLAGVSGLRRGLEFFY